MQEIDVFNAVRGYLIAETFKVIQLVPPGGQAPLSVSYLHEGKRRTIFPDMLALKDRTVWVGEFKPMLDMADYAKLQDLALSGGDAVLDLCVRVTKGNCPIEEVRYTLCHGENNTHPVPATYQWVFNASTEAPKIIYPG